MSVTINGTSGLVFNDASTQNTAATGFGFKNRLINSAMVIDQRNNGGSISANGFPLDRWAIAGTLSSKWTAQQNAGSVTPPAGFTNYLGVTSTSSYSVTSTDTFQAYQAIEGLNVSDLGWGTANAQPITLSFWVRSSLTGTFGGVLVNGAFNYSYPFTYTINSANTWEQKSVTIAGPTAGTWITNNGVGVYVMFSFGSGSSVSGTAGAWTGSGLRSATGAVSVVGTNGATFYITGVQFEKGSTATSFDYRPYGTELALCQRYYQLNQSGVGKFGSSTSFAGSVALAVAMRTTPTTVLINGTGGIDELYNTTRNITAAPGPYSSSLVNGFYNGGQFVCDCAGATSGAMGLYLANRWAMISEL